MRRTLSRRAHRSLKLANHIAVVPRTEVPPDRQADAVVCRANRAIHEHDGDHSGVITAGGDGSVRQQTGAGRASFPARDEVADDRVTGGSAHTADDRFGIGRERRRESGLVNFPIDPFRVTIGREFARLEARDIRWWNVGSFQSISNSRRIGLDLRSAKCIADPVAEALRREFAVWGEGAVTGSASDRKSVV